MKKELNRLGNEQYVSEGFTRRIDNLVLQKILDILDYTRIPVDGILEIDLGTCLLGNKQRILIKGQFDECISCNFGANEKVVVYQIEKNKQFIGIRSEFEELDNTGRVFFM